MKTNLNDDKTTNSNENLKRQSADEYKKHCESFKTSNFNKLLLYLICALLLNYCFNQPTVVPVSALETLQHNSQDNNGNENNNLVNASNTANTNKIPDSTSNSKYFPFETGEDSKQNDESKKNPSEIQKAFCTITAGEVKASAEAVTTKTLEGVCGSAELHSAFNKLETRLFGELQELKNLLTQLILQTNSGSNHLMDSQSDRNPLPVQTSNLQITLNNERYNAITKVEDFPKEASDNVFKLQKITDQKEVQKISLKEASKQLLNVTKEIQNAIPQLKSLEHHHQGEHKAALSRVHKPIREDEVLHFNNTLLKDRDLKVFTYYWRIENFTIQMKNSETTIVDSPCFTIKNKSLVLKAYLQHLHRDFLYLQLKYASPDASKNSKGTKSGISLNMGLQDLSGTSDLFKEINDNEKMIFKYKIIILDQLNWRSKDLVSQEFHNLESGFLIPNSALMAGPFIKNDTLLKFANFYADEPCKLLECME